jgi:hypothetical protein
MKGSIYEWMLLGLPSCCADPASKDFAEELFEGDALFEGVSEGSLGVDCVAVSSAVFFAGDDFGLFELGDDALDGALGDSDLNRDVAQASFGISQEADEDVGVVRKERPAVRGF